MTSFYCGGPGVELPQVGDREAVLESKRKRGIPRESAGKQFDSPFRQASRLYANWRGPKCRIEYEQLADAVGLWQAGDVRLSRDRAREIAVRLGTEFTEEELNDLYDTAFGYVGDVWEIKARMLVGFGW